MFPYHHFLEEPLMRRALVSIVAAVAMTAFANNLLAFGIEIDVAPSVVSPDSQGQVVTVHTDIAYWSVDVSDVRLNGLLIQSWKADNRGNFVAKFNLDDVKTMIDVGIVTVELTGTATRDEVRGPEDFIGIDTIRVIQPRK